MKRALGVLGVAAVVGAGVLTAATPGAAVTSHPKPTVVLVHGAFEDASAWTPVTRRLLAEHYPVLAPAVPLRGVAADVASLQGVLDSVPGPKILVGHSYGGLLISELAGSTSEVKALVYAAAFIPEAGETAGQLNARFPGSLIGPSTTHAVGPDLFVNAASYPSLFAAGLPALDTAVAAAGQRPILAAAFDEKVLSTAPSGIAKYALVATRDQAIPPAAERFEARRAHASITEVPSPHAIASAAPDAVVDVIHRASR
ncbi:alpha/beta hydrolase [Amycolatopsis sp. FBCC-B4732]|uniref:alpha/beta fold hydrolase n=1 Tax=Amycolatopsis sp. FBCC-B4732 TaxID=3079339 RepID=UPI001FF6C40D|nr:alpha/beta hydrolase [Amycolatopsis sp. FBCC-B4732]UOX89161.1 alpha/beta hydrolase [Amycolatopsis sp. FBCC-B4732]